MKIDIEHYDYTCGDGCCYEYGVYLSIDGKRIEDESFGSEEQALEYVLVKVLGHELTNNEGGYYCD